MSAPVERLARSGYRFPRSSYRAARRDAMTTAKCAVPVKSALDDLKEELDVVCGRRLAQPEGLAMMLAFVARRRAEFFDEVARLTRPSAAARGRPR